MEWAGVYPGEYICQNSLPIHLKWASLVVQTVKNLPAMQETQVPSLDWKDSLEKGMATQSSILPGEFHGQRPQSMGLQKFEHD